MHYAVWCRHSKEDSGLKEHRLRCVRKDKNGQSGYGSQELHGETLGSKQPAHWFAKKRIELRAVPNEGPVAPGAMKLGRMPVRELLQQGTAGDTSSAA